jgi:hypothetical protein
MVRLYRRARRGRGTKGRLGDPSLPASNSALDVERWTFDVFYPSR